MGSGVPIGAIVVGPRALNVLGPGNHGTTFGGNPQAMRAGEETIRIMEEEGLLANAAAMGTRLKDGLAHALAAELKSGAVKEIRGMGLMLGIDLAKPCAALVGQCAENGLLISVTADSVVRLVPPLIINAKEIDELVGILAPLIKQHLAKAE